MTDQPAPAYLDPLHDELDRLRTAASEMGEKVAQYRDAIVPALESNADGWAKRAEQAEARVDQLTDQLALANDTLRRRGLAVNATGTSNDALRAKVERARVLVDVLRGLGLEIVAGRFDEALADQEPTP